jgi:hypothetical protein
MQAIGKLLLLFENLFEIGMTVTECDVLQTVLVHLLVLFCFNTFPILYNFCVKFPACTTEYCVLCNTAFELFELVLNFFAFSLFLVKFGL